MRRLRSFWRLHAPERRLLVTSWLVVAAARAALWVTPFRILHRAVERRVVDGPAVSGPSALRIGWAVSTASRYVPRASCVTQAVAAQLLLQRAGHVSSLRLGAACGPHGEFEAHAWVECDGIVVVGGAELERYTPFPATRAPAGPRLPGSAP
jgi:hypothetical protein